MRQRVRLMRAYRQLETCFAPDRDLEPLPACLPVHKAAYNHNDTLIQTGLLHGTPASGLSRYET